MHLLFETPVGYALFRVDESRFRKAKSWKDLPQTPERIAALVQLAAFKPFKDAKESLQASVKMVHGKLSTGLRKFITANVVSDAVRETLLVGEKKIAAEITRELGIKCDSGEMVTELHRVVRFAIEELLESYFQPAEARSMSLGLAHGLGRFRIKFSAEKVDTMVIQAISLHEDLDKEINNYMMRLREWYGYHFPELARCVPDNVAYAHLVRAIGHRKNAATADLSALAEEPVVEEIRAAAETSIGTDIAEADEGFIAALAEQILELDQYRAQLEEYLKNRMAAVAPNLSALMGEVIAAKLIAKAGSLVNLAKMSGSTIQIIGAEKALFKAMRARKNTPKYGIIYQAKLVSSANGRAKARIARALAAKAALCVRFDALAEEEATALGQESSDYLEKRLRYLETTEAQQGLPAERQSFPKQPAREFHRGGHNPRRDFTRAGPPRPQRGAPSQFTPVKKPKLQ